MGPSRRGRSVSTTSHCTPCGVQGGDASLAGPGRIGAAGPRVTELLTYEGLGPLNGRAQLRVLCGGGVEGPPDDPPGLDVVLPQPGQPPAVDDRVVGQVRQVAEALARPRYGAGGVRVV